jgi:rubrerythrin
MSIFAASDVLQFAIRMEENGRLFYHKAAELAGNGVAKKLFEFLASEEETHKKTFEEILAHSDVNLPTEDYPGEYLSYLRQYIDDKIFFSNEKELSKNIDIASALDFAIRREMDSILYYSELKGFLTTEEVKIIDKIIEEERKHFAQLSALRNQK